MKHLVSALSVIVVMMMMGTARVVSAEKFFEYVCTSSQCSSGCTNYEYDTNTCYPTTSGDSMKVRCRDGGMTIEQTIFEGSTDCNSFSHSNTVAAGDCGEIAGVPGEWMLYICGAGGEMHLEGKKIHAAHQKRNVSAFIGPARLSVTEDISRRAAQAQVGVKTTRSFMEIPREMLLLSSSSSTATAARKFAIAFSNSEIFPLTDDDCHISSESGSLRVKHEVFKKASSTKKSGKKIAAPHAAASILVDQRVLARFTLKN